MPNSFVFVGFQPADELIKLAQKIYREITELCPEDGDVSGTLHSDGNQFVCRMVVKSLSIAFNVESIASESLRALNEVHRKAKQNISQWHKERFSA